MIKKLISICIILTILLTLITTTHANNTGNTKTETEQNKVVLYINSINYDNQTNQYIASYIDENEEIWIIELLTVNKYTISTHKLLEKLYLYEHVEATFESYNNDNLYDDEIINFTLIVDFIE